MDRVHVMQLVRSLQVGEVSRRAFLRRATLATGSLASANMLLAACSTAPDDQPRPVVGDAGDGSGEGTGRPDGSTSQAAPDAVSAARITFGEMGDRPLSGYFASHPDAGGPGVVLIQEWWGLNEHIEDVARRLAGEGYAVLAPDLYHGAVVTEPDEARKLVMALDMEAAVAEIALASEFLRGQPMVTGQSVGIVGFCLGGGLALQAGLSDPNAGAIVAFYGTPLTPEESGGMRAGAVLGLYGAEDGGIDVADVEDMATALEAAGVATEIEIYEGAQHAFFNDTRASHHPEAATDAWGKLLAFLETHLG